MSHPALMIDSMSKSYRTTFLRLARPVIQDLSLVVPPGEIFGFLGPNGAGKTTTIKCILGLLTPEKGQISLFGHPSGGRAANACLGYLPENPYFYDYLTAPELVALSARLHGQRRGPELKHRISELLEQVGLQGHGNRKLKTFSKGMVQRVGFAQALVNDPALLILDEPFSGLDPIGRKEMRDLILAQKAAGKTIFFSSHILQDMELIADRVGILKKGRLSRVGPLGEMLQNSIQGYEITFTGIQRERLQSNNISAVSMEGALLTKTGTLQEMNRLVEFIVLNRGTILGVTPLRRTLEDIFMDEVNA